MNDSPKNLIFTLSFEYLQWNLSKALGPTEQKLSIIERVSSGQGFIIHYVGYIWDSVSVHYRGMRGVL